MADETQVSTQSGSGIRMKHRFEVYRSDAPDEKFGSFKTVGGLELITEVVEWRKGNSNSVIKLPGDTSFPPITLEKGFDSGKKLKNWYDRVWSLKNGGNASTYRYDLTIKIFNRNGTLFKQITAVDAWPSKYAADDLDGQSSDPWVESAEIQHNGWDYDDVEDEQVEDPDFGNDAGPQEIKL